MLPDVPNLQHKDEDFQISVLEKNYPHLQQDKVCFILCQEMLAEYMIHIPTRKESPIWLL